MLQIKKTKCLWQKRKGKHDTIYSMAMCPFVLPTYEIPLLIFISKQQGYSWCNSRISPGSVSARESVIAVGDRCWSNHQVKMKIMNGNSRKMGFLVDITSSQKLGRCASRRVHSAWKSSGRANLGSKKFGPKESWRKTEKVEEKLKEIGEEKLIKLRKN